jgi:hypothetical protein
MNVASGSHRWLMNLMDVSTQAVGGFRGAAFIGCIDQRVLTLFPYC